MDAAYCAVELLPAGEERGCEIKMEAAGRLHYEIAIRRLWIQHITGKRVGRLIVIRRTSAPAQARCALSDAYKPYACQNALTRGTV